MTRKKAWKVQHYRVKDQSETYSRYFTSFNKAKEYVKEYEEFIKPSIIFSKEATDMYFIEVDNGMGHSLSTIKSFTDQHATFPWVIQSIYIY